MPNGEGALISALNELAALGTERDRERLVALLDRLCATSSCSPVSPPGP